MSFFLFAGLEASLTSDLCKRTYKALEVAAMLGLLVLGGRAVHAGEPIRLHILERKEF
jgi:hypothetical protein